MIEIPENLPSELIPVAWLLGEWQGWGISENKDWLTVDPEKENNTSTSRLIWQETSFWVEQTHLAQKTMLYQAIAKNDAPEMMDDAPTGLKKLTRGSLLWREDLLWRVQVWAPAEGEQPAQARLVAESQGGPYQMIGEWEAQSLGPRLMAQTKAWKPLEDSTSNQPIRSERMHGLVQGELFWSQETEISTGRIVDFSGRMMRKTVA